MTDEERHDEDGLDRLASDLSGKTQAKAKSEAEKRKRKPKSTNGSGEEHGPPEPPPPLTEFPDEIPRDPSGDVTEQGVMRAFVDLYRHKLRYNHDRGTWLVWNGHYWKPDRHQLAFLWSLNLCRNAEASKVVQKVRFSAAVEWAAKAMPPISTAAEDWNQDPDLIGTPGGVLSSEHFLRPGTPGDMITQVTSVTPAEIPDCPLWTDFLDYAFNGNQRIIAFMQRWFGYCLTGHTNEEFFIFLYGPPGTGKGTIVRTVRAIMGDYAAPIPMDQLTGHASNKQEYYRANLAGKRLMIAAEPEQGSTWAEAFINESTGGDPLSGRHPGGRPFDFFPTHKLMIHGNNLPGLKGLGTGIKRRLGLVPANRKPNPPDPHLKQKLVAEYPAILRWMIEGEFARKKLGGLFPPPEVVAATADYFAQQDRFGRFIDDCATLDPDAELPPGVIRAAFNRWARDNGEAPMSTNEMHDAIENCTRGKLRETRVQGRFTVRGLRLNAEPDPRFPD